MSSVKDGLKKIYLFKSADYQFAEIDISDNTLLLGESGVGKTTLMRAILFFYTMDSSSTLLNINTESKKSFTQWYFQEPNSHVVYEYQKENQRYLFIVSNSGKLHYRFVEMSQDNVDVRGLFLDGNEPVTLEKLTENIERASLVSYHTTQKEKYIRAFHKKDIEGKRIKQETPVDFTLFESMAIRKEFAKTLSNIFSTSKVSADSVKKTIVSLLEEVAVPINLKKIAMSLVEYVTFREEIRKFEKKVSIVEELKRIREEYFADKKNFMQSANRLYEVKQQGDKILLKLEQGLQRAKDDRELIEEEYKPKIKELESKVEDLAEKIIEKKVNIKKLEDKEKEYQKRDIDRLVLEHKQEKVYINNLDKTKRRYEVLTSNSKRLNEEYENILNRLTLNKQETLLDLKEEFNLEKERIDLEIRELSNKKNSLIEEEIAPLVKERDGFKKELSSKIDKLNEIKIQQAKVENFPYNQGAIEKYTRELEKFNSVKIEIESKIRELEFNIERVDEKIAKMPQKLTEQKERHNKRVQEQREKLLDKKAKIEERLDFDKDNLYGYINRNSVKSQERLLTFLKDEVLFSQKLSMVEEVSNSESIFGLKVEFEESAFEFEYSIEELQKELKSLKNSIKEINRVSHDELVAIENSQREENSKLERERTKYYKDLEEKRKELASYEEYIVKSSHSLEEAKREAKYQRKEEQKSLNIKAIAYEEEISSLNSKIESLTQEIAQKQNSIEEQTKSSIEQLRDKLKKLSVKNKEQSKEVEEHYKREKEQIEEERRERLEKQGVNKEQLLKLENQKKEYKQKLKSIEENYGYVSVYLSEYHKEIEKLPSLREELQKERERSERLANGLNRLRYEFSKELQTIDNIVKDIENKKGKLDSFLELYSEKIEKNSSLYIRVKGALNLNYKSNIDEDDYDGLENIVKSIVEINRSIDSHSDAIINKVQRVTGGLKRDNIFKLSIIDDFLQESGNVEEYLKVAKEFIEYVDNNKLSYLKETSSKKFSHELNSIKKYIMLFENALMDVEELVNRLDKMVKKAVESFRVIDAIRIQKELSNNEILEKLKSVTSFYEENSEELLTGLFNDEKQSQVQEKLGSKIEELAKLLNTSKEFLSLEDNFVLTFSVTEKGNKLKPAQSLNDIGSNGTSTLVKSIINISLLQMVNTKSQLLNHCILDEIGTISPSYFRELKEYANKSGFLFVNGMPTEDDIVISMYPTVYIGQNYGNYSRMLLASKLVV